MGIQNVVADFEESFRANNLPVVKETAVLPAERVRRAIATGFFEGGGRRYPCEDEVREATNLMLNRIADTYQRIAGGALGWDTIILTGGGSAVLYNKLLPILNHEHVVLADDIETIHLANVRGGLKLWRLYEALSVYGERTVRRIQDSPASITGLTDSFIASIKKAAKPGVTLN